MEHQERAKHLLTHYLNVLARKATGEPLHWECRAEIEEIVDEIVLAAIEEHEKIMETSEQALES